MYTQCPKCQSIFTVSEHDIHAHEGLVRCGNCYSVFNASANLTDDPQKAEVDDSPSVPAGTGAPATPIMRPLNSSEINTSSAFTFNFIEEPGIPAPERSAEQAEHDDTDDEAEHDAEMDAFPVPDFDKEETREASDSSPAVVEEEEEEEDSLLYFGQDDDMEAQADTGEPEPEPEPEEDGSALLQNKVFNPATAAEKFATAAYSDPAVDSETPTHEQIVAGPTEGNIDDLSAFKVPAADSPETEILAANEDQPGPEISLDREHAKTDFALPDFSPLDKLEPGSPATDKAEASSITDESPADPTELEHVETKLDEIALWPTLDDDEETEPARADPLPDMDASPRFLPDETYDALQAFDDDVQDVGLVEPGLSAEARSDVADDTDAEEQNETESVFITSDADGTDDYYQAINVEHDKAFHKIGSDFPLPDEINDLSNYDDTEIDRLMRQAIDNQTELTKKDAAGQLPPGIADVVDELDVDYEEVQEPSPEERPTASADPAELDKDTGKLSALLSKITSSRHAGHPADHSPDALEIKDSEKTRIFGQQDNTGQGGPLIFMPAGIKRVLLILANVALIVLLLLQTARYFMDDLVQVSALRPVLEAGCKLAGCRVPDASNPASIELMSSKMALQEGKNAGLRIAVTLINRDHEEQPYPVMQLSLTDRAGKIISRRLVKPDQYLGSTARMRKLQPGKAEDIYLLLRTPNVRVDGFELRPVKTHWLDPQ